MGCWSICSTFHLVHRVPTLTSLILCYLFLSPLFGRAGPIPISQIVVKSVTSLQSGPQRQLALPFLSYLPLVAWMLACELPPLHSTYTKLTTCMQSHFTHHWTHIRSNRAPDGTWHSFCVSLARIKYWHNQMHLNTVAGFSEKSTSLVLCHRFPHSIHCNPSFWYTQPTSLLIHSGHSKYCFAM